MEHDGMKKQKKSLYRRENMAITNGQTFKKRWAVTFCLSAVVVVVGRYMLYLLLYLGTNCFMYTRYREGTGHIGLSGIHYYTWIIFAV